MKEYKFPLEFTYSVIDIIDMFDKIDTKDLELMKENINQILHDRNHETKEIPKKILGFIQ